MTSNTTETTATTNPTSVDTTTETLGQVTEVPRTAPENSVTATRPTPGTLVDTAFTSADYRDEFVVSTATAHERVDDFARAYFLAQPGWLSLVSSGIWAKEKRQALLAGHRFDAGSSIGSWKVYDRTDDEIMFGDNMGFMEYRFSMRLDPEDGQRIFASTAVHYLWRRTGRFYFALAKQAHTRFVPFALGKAAAAPAMVTR
jgi:hypothetical protein